jgi:2-hydroxychromene-2-carboxylate isomerase
VPRVEFLYDFGSPASYIAYARMPAIAARTGAVVVHRPVLLGAVFKATGNHSPAQVPAKGKWMMDDLRRFARRHGVRFESNPFFPVNTLHLMRAAVAAEREGRLVAYSDAIFHAMWAEPRDLRDPKIVREVVARAGFDAEALLAAAEEPEIKEALRRSTEEAVARGMFGAPTFFVGGEMFFGQDRLDFVEEALRAEA